ncbi:MAG: hypothetical protein AAGA95_10225 [Pseudomonadota bacterium]
MFKTETTVGAKVLRDGSQRDADHRNPTSIVARLAIVFTLAHFAGTPVAFPAEDRHVAKGAAPHAGKP